MLYLSSKSSKDDNKLKHARIHTHTHINNIFHYKRKTPPWLATKFRTLGVKILCAQYHPTYQCRWCIYDGMPPCTISPLHGWDSETSLTLSNSTKEVLLTMQHISLPNLQIKSEGIPHISIDLKNSICFWKWGITPLFSIRVKPQWNGDFLTSIKDIHTKLIHLQTIVPIKHEKNRYLLCSNSTKQRIHMQKLYLGNLGKDSRLLGKSKA